MSLIDAIVLFDEYVMMMAAGYHFLEPPMNWTVANPLKSTNANYVYTGIKRVVYVSFFEQ